MPSSRVMPGRCKLLADSPPSTMISNQLGIVNQRHCSNLLGLRFERDKQRLRRRWLLWRRPVTNAAERHPRKFFRGEGLALAAQESAHYLVELE